MSSKLVIRVKIGYGGKGQNDGVVRDAVYHPHYRVLLTARLECLLVTMETADERLPLAL